MPQPSHSKIFVTGTSGHLGRLVVGHLLDSGATDVLAGSRRPEALADLSARGAEPRRADFDDPASLDRAFAGAERILIISALDTPDDPPRRLRQHLAAVDAAVRAGVQHIVYTSMAKPEPGSAIPFAPDHYSTEQAIEKSGVPFTILRPNFYAESFFMWLPRVLASGQWFTAAGQGRAAYVWRDDLARTAAAALLEDGTASRRLDVSGPQALTPTEIVAAVNTVFGASVALVPVSEAQLAEGLKASGLPAALVELLVAIDANKRQGGLEIVSDTVQRLTGQPARSIADFLSANRAALLAAARQAAGH